MAAALLAARTAEIGVDVRVSSAGVLDAGRPASAHSVDILAARGVDLSAHRSATVTRELLRAADLVVTMAREHVRHAVVLFPEAWPRTFTLKNLVVRGEKAGPRQPEEDVPAWLARVHAGRVRAELMGSSPEDDVADPIGRPRPAYDRMVGELDDLVERLVTLLWPTEAHRGEG